MDDRLTAGPCLIITFEGDPGFKGTLPVWARVFKACDNTVMFELTDLLGDLDTGIMVILVGVFAGEMGIL